MTSSQYQTYFDDRIAQGLKPVHVDSYLDGGAVRYVAIFTSQGHPSWAAYHGASGASHQSMFNTLTGQGFRPVTISVVQVSGTLRFTALYDKKNVGGWSAPSVLTSAQYDQAVDDNAAAGRRLAYLNGYTQNGVAKFSAIFDSTSYSSWGARHDQSFSQFQNEFDLRTGQGFLTKIVTGYERGNVANFGGFWIKN